MKEKAKLLMLSLIAMIASLSLSSCGNDDEPQVTEDYYLCLTAVETNLVNAETGESLASALKAEFISGSELDANGKFHMGNTTMESAENAFNQSIANFTKSFNDAYAGKNLLPENGYIVYRFSMETKSGKAVETASIRVTNSGASKI